jgi:NAD(P)-dependent dehydrogenase (short-subunit alcohol dehydrogenase family)
MSSIGGAIGIPFQAFYSASKFALEGLGEALAYEVAPLGVHVTLVEPGNVKTDFTASRRMAQAAGADPVYGAALTKAVGLMERDEANGVPAADVAAVVRRVLELLRWDARVAKDREPGTLRLDVWEVEGEPGVVYVYEVYRCRYPHLPPAADPRRRTE